VVPIAISLAFGVLLATVITLFVVPCGYLILDDVGRWIGTEVRRRLGRAPDPLAAEDRLRLMHGGERQPGARSRSSSQRSMTGA
jgi:hypothetical protein